MASSITQATRLIGLVMISSLFVIGCKEEAKPYKPSAPAPTVAPAPEIVLLQTPSFDQDRAYAFVKKQVDFGPRVPNSAAQKACAKWLENELASAGLTTNVQEATVKAFNGVELEIFNIMGQINPNAEKRILLCSHWDSRPFADRDTEDRNKAIDGANDGASGVGVLLELAHTLAKDTNIKNLGIDIVFFDAEDYGKPQSAMVGDGADSWCLGSQYWAANLPIEGYTADFGILLDMVGAADAVFPKESFSMQFAQEETNHIWRIAQALGYKKQFPNQLGNPITDDHVYLNRIANIPTVDIIHYNAVQNDFFPHHHQHSDNMDIIEANTLGIIGEVLLQVIYQEK